MQYLVIYASSSKCYSLDFVGLLLSYLFRISKVFVETSSFGCSVGLNRWASLDYAPTISYYVWVLSFYTFSVCWDVYICVWLYYASGAMLIDYFRTLVVLLKSTLEQELLEKYCYSTSQTICCFIFFTFLYSYVLFNDCWFDFVIMG